MLKPKPNNKMALFRCENCGIEKKILKQTILIVRRKLLVKEAKCICGNYMKDQTKHKGFGTSFKAPNDKKN